MLGSQLWPLLTEHPDCSFTMYTWHLNCISSIAAVAPSVGALCYAVADDVCHSPIPVVVSLCGRVYGAWVQGFVGS
jgi:hypothetical protein